MVEQKKLLFLITVPAAPVSPDLLKFLAYFDVRVCKFISKYDCGRIFRGFVCAIGQDTDKISTQKEKMKGSFLQFYVNPFRIKNIAANIYLFNPLKASVALI